MGSTEIVGAPLGERTLLFVDDVNMPRAEPYGAQPSLEVLRSLADQGLLYSAPRNRQLRAHDVRLVCAMAHGRGARPPARLSRHFNVLAVAPFGGEQVRAHAFCSLLYGMFFFNCETTFFFWFESKSLYQYRIL